MHQPYWQRTRSVFSIHNMAYQGGFDLGELPGLGFTSSFARNAFSFNGYASAMKAGLEVSDTLSTVSRRYAHEIQTAENGYGLDWLTRQRANRLIGITNGVDYEVWNPEADVELPSHFSIGDLSGKLECKRALLEQFHLPIELDRPIFASITRLTSQKGVELIRQGAGDILAAGGLLYRSRFGWKKPEKFLQSLRDYAPSRVSVCIGCGRSLARLIEAGAACS